MYVILSALGCLGRKLTGSNTWVAGFITARIGQNWQWGIGELISVLTTSENQVLSCHPFPLRPGTI